MLVGGERGGVMLGMKGHRNQIDVDWGESEEGAGDNNVLETKRSLDVTC